jgi:hypothetical protein
MIIAGHGRLAAAIETGLMEVSVIEISNLSNAQKASLALADNRIALNAIAEDSGARLITQAELLGHASDADGPSLTATDLGMSSGSGTLVRNLTTWSYTPSPDDDTDVMFSYAVSDGVTAPVVATAVLDIVPEADMFVFHTPSSFSTIDNFSHGSTLTSFENLIGSGHDDMLTGSNSGSNILIGGAGNDTLNGGGGVEQGFSSAKIEIALGSRFRNIGLRLSRVLRGFAVIPLST